MSVVLKPWYQEDYFPSFILAILSLSSEELISDWLTLSERSRDQLFPQLVEAYRATRSTMTDFVHRMSSDSTLRISPLTVFTLTEKIRKSKSKKDVEESFAQFRIPLKAFQLKEVKPYAVNSIDALGKLYLLTTYNDVTLYLQVARAIKSHKVVLDKDTIEAIALTHAALSTLLLWYRLAAAMSEIDPELDDKSLEDDPVYVQTAPDPQLVIDTTRQAVDILRSVKIFPPVLIRMLKQEEDLRGFFTLIDAILMVTKSVELQEEMPLRRRLASLTMMHDLIMSNNDWYQYYSNSQFAPTLR